MLASGVVSGWYQRRLPVDSLSPIDVQPICELSRGPVCWLLFTQRGRSCWVFKCIF